MSRVAVRTLVQDMPCGRGCPHPFLLFIVTDVADFPEPCDHEDGATGFHFHLLRHSHDGQDTWWGLTPGPRGEELEIPDSPVVQDWLHQATDGDGFVMVATADGLKGIQARVAAASVRKLLDLTNRGEPVQARCEVFAGTPGLMPEHQH